MSDFDVIVIGAGNAALCAAIAATENDARVLVLEKAPRHMRGGNTYWSGGMFRFAYGDRDELDRLVPGTVAAGGVLETAEPYGIADFRNDLTSVTNGRADPVLARLVVEGSMDAMIWLREACHVEMEPALSIAAVRKGDRYSWLRGLAVRAASGGIGLSESLFRHCESIGVEISYDTAALSLSIDRDGSVDGVRVRTEGNAETLRAKSVILACGGFEANVEMRARYIGSLIGAATVRGTPYNQGDGLRMALDVSALPAGQWSGCHAAPISADWGEFAPRDKTDQSNRISYPFGVMINRKGLRFVDEGKGTHLSTYAEYGRAILGQPGSTVYQVFDAVTAPLIDRAYGSSIPVVAETLEGLVDLLDVDDKDRALATLKAFNAAARSHPDGSDPLSGFDPSRLDGLATLDLAPNKTNWAMPLLAPPFSAYTATGGITFTFGGLRINEHAGVMGTDWRPIRGLYACGEIVGGLFHDSYPAGTGLTAGAVIGRIAGRNAALRTPALGGHAWRSGGDGLSSSVDGSRPLRAGAMEGWVP
ncbi:MAG: FAD-dependent tricarballylate dehydrogenase TcuA [Rhizobiaceae bacterium]